MCANGGTMVTFFQISDTHLVKPGHQLADVIDPAAQLQKILDRIVESGTRPAGLLLTGDLADRGDRQAYQLLRHMVWPVAENLGCPVLSIPGNHDDRLEFATEILRAAEPARRLDWVVEVSGVRIIALDSQVPGAQHGQLDQWQLDRVRQLLSTPAPHGSLLLLHHPPIPSPLPTMTSMALRDPERLAAAVRGTDLRMIVCGHNHYAGAGALGGVPVWVGAASVYRGDTTPPHGIARSTAAGGFSRIDVFTDQAVASALPAAAEDTAFVLTDEQLAAFLGPG